MEPVKDQVRVYNARDSRIVRDKVLHAVGKGQALYCLVGAAVFIGIWQLAANHYHSAFLLPSPWRTAVTFVTVVQDPEVLKNLAITLRRVLTGFLYALAIGIPLGFIMGYSVTALRSVDPLIQSLRQVPIMAWVPLTIVWFGLGDGPTIFLITLVGIFPIILNTIAGVQSISHDYYNAARSMGAGPLSIFTKIIVPASLPDILTGSRIAAGLGWMSVI